MSEGKLSQIRGKITGVKPKDSNGDTEKLPYVVDDEDYTPNRLKFASFFGIGHLLRLVMKELAIFLLLFYALNFFYRFGMTSGMQDEFERVVAYFDDNLSFYGKDITFLLGFYVSLVAKRWWDQFRLLPWPDDIAMSLTGLVVTDKKENLHLRHTIMRYVLLSYLLCIRRFSGSLKKHFPDVKTIIKEGLIKRRELALLHINDVSDDTHAHGNLLNSNWWLPLAWANNIVKVGKNEKHIPSDTKELHKVINKFRSDLSSVEGLSFVTIPLVYKIVVNMAVYTYFTLAVVSTQLGMNSSEFDPYFPFPIVLKLIFFIGWLKVAQALEQPFGQDETDFKMDLIFKRHIRATAVILAQFDQQPPMKEDDENGEEIIQDQFVTAKDLTTLNHPPAAIPYMDNNGEENVDVFNLKRINDGGFSSQN